MAKKQTNGDQHGSVQTTDNKGVSTTKVVNLVVVDGKVVVDSTQSGVTV